MGGMITITSAAERDILQTNLRGPLAEVHWYAAYTSANHEKKVAAELQRRSVECFLPLYSSVRRWQDRRVKLELPLFPSYIFVHLPLQERLRVLQVPGVVRLVGFGNCAAPVPEIEITRIRDILNQGLRTEPHRYLTAGRRVRVKTGPLVGLEGIVVRRKNQLRFVVSVELIMRSMAVEVDLADIEPVQIGLLRAACTE
jgi:transcription antitermination factor NusG